MPLLLFLLLNNTLLAQPKISVKSFERKDNDSTARLFSPKKDQNGDICAIIKVVSNQTGFTWESDGLGIVAAEPKTGEYWIYVPFGAKLLTIQHPQLGILRDYMFPLPIEKATVYMLELTTDETIVNSRSVTINSEPEGLELAIDGKPFGQTPYVGNLSFGNHNLRLQQGEKRVWKIVYISQIGGQTSFNLSFSEQSLDKNVNDASIEMVAIKGGTFQMGSNGNDDEKPIHTVMISDFYIGKTEVTQAQWIAIMGSNPSYFKGDNLPVEQVSWDDVQVFIDKLNAKTGKTYRLPTEAEWEYAAGGGENNRTVFAGTNDESNLGNYAWWGKNNNGTTHAVGTKKPNQLGIYDMSGNVWEWCSDWYSADYYLNSPENNPKGPASGSSRVMRGGSWLSMYEFSFRASSRSSNVPGLRYYNASLRVAKDL